MELIFNAPWWLYVVPAVLGLGMAYAGLRRGDKTLRVVGLGLLLAGVGVYVASTAVETDVETVARRSRELVHSVEKREWDRLSSLLDPGAAVRLLGVGEIYSNREQIVTACRSRADGAGVTSLAVTSLEPKREGVAQVSTEVQIYITASEGGGRPFPSRWRFVWTRHPDGQWLVRDIEAIEIGNFRAADAQSQFPPVK